MARVVIEIDGDSSGAEEALEDVQGALGDLDGAAGSAGDSFGGLNTKLVNVASGASLAKMGFDAVRGGINMLWESTERYFQSSEDGQEKWEALERQGRALKGMLFELFIGTNDQNEAFEEMSEFLGDLVAGARGAMQILQPMANLLRGALSAGARMVALAFGDAGSMTEQFAGQLETAEDRLESLQDALGQQDGPIGQSALLLEAYGEAAARAIAEVADSMGNVSGQEFDPTPMTHGFDEATEIVRRNIEDILASAGSLEDLEVATSGVFVDGTRVVGRGVDNIREALEGVTIEIQGRSVPAIEAFGSALEANRILLDAEDEAARSASLGVSSSSRSAEEATEVFGGLGGAMGMASMMTAQLATDEEFLAGRIQAATSAANERLIQEKIAARDRASLLEEEIRRKDEAAKAEEIALLRMEALKDALDAKEATRSAKQQERVNIAKGGFQTLTNSAIGMAAAHIKAGKQSREETRKLIGDELVALGAAGLAKAAMMVFEPGKQALAAGLAVASLAAMGLGAKMGANSSGGSVAAPAATQAPQSQTNVTFQNNFSQIGSREQFLRVTGDTFQQAVDEGYIAIPRG